MGKKSSPKAPAAPDPVAVSNAQAAANKESAIAQANLNRIDQITPGSSLTYKQIGLNEDGTPKYQQTQTYTGSELNQYNQQNQINESLNGLAVDNIDRVKQAQSKPFTFDGMVPQVTGVGQGLGALNYGAAPSKVQGQLDYSGLTALPGTSDFGAQAKATQNAVYSQATSRLDPQYGQAQDDLTSRLANQGIAVGSDAYNRAQGNQDRAKTDAYNQANYSAIQAGSAEQSRLFGLSLAARQQGQGEADAKGAFANSAISQQTSMDQAAAALNNQTRSQGFNEQASNAALQNQGRQQQITEASYLRNLPLNEIASLMGTGGGLTGPTFQGVSQVGVAAPDYQGAVYNSFNAQQQQYQQAQAQKSAALGSVFGLAGTAATMFSDARLKHNIVRIGELANGLATYVFSYLGHSRREFGVMAQDVLRVSPEAVSIAPNGYMMVDYGKVYGGY